MEICKGMHPVKDTRTWLYDVLFKGMCTHNRKDTLGKAKEYHFSVYKIDGSRRTICAVRTMIWVWGLQKLQFYYKYKFWNGSYMYAFTCACPKKTQAECTTIITVFFFFITDSVMLSHHFNQNWSICCKLCCFKRVPLVMIYKKNDEDDEFQSQHSMSLPIGILIS